MIKRAGKTVLVAVVALALFAGVAGAVTRIQCQSGVTCEGGDRVDWIDGTNGDDTIYGYGGPDEIEGFDGGDTIHGGRGNDSIYGQDGGDTIYGGRGNDVIRRSSGSDTIYGNDGWDLLEGGGGSNFMEGGPGEDYLTAAQVPYEEPGEDNVKGGPDDDLIYTVDGQRDVIDCGGGERDEVEFDRGLDTVTKCERKVAR